MIVETGSAFTYVVFHHALRIRLKSNILDSGGDTGDSKNDIVTSSDSTRSTTAATMTPGTNTPHSEETTDTGATTPTASEGVANPTAQPMDDKPEEKTGHLIGKINNLITTDLSAVANIQEIVELRTCDYYC